MLAVSVEAATAEETAATQEAATTAAGVVNGEAAVDTNAIAEGQLAAVAVAEEQPAVAKIWQLRQQWQLTRQQ